MLTRYGIFAALPCAWLLASQVSCTTPNPNYQRPSDGGAECVPETDAAFCARVGATCEDATREDNCGVVRTATCGTCSGTDACVANVCRAPICSTFSFPNRTLLSAPLNDPAQQDALAGVSADGKTVLWQRSPCYAKPFDLLIGDATSGTFVATNLTTQPEFATMAITQERTLALTADGLTIIGSSSDRTQFLQTTRTAVGVTAFGAASNVDFAALNVSAPTRIIFPAISNDGLTFYFRMIDNPDSSLNGLYETVRTSKTVPFPSATKMPGVVQSYESITAVSSDRMTLFVQNYSFQMAALTRKSIKDAFANPNFPGPAPIPPGFRARPLGDCQAVIATYSEAGCLGETLAIFTR